MFSFLNDIDNYEDRKVSRDETGGVKVSTVYTSDEGYETAIIDANGVHPVERYPSKEDSEKGHAKWLEFAEDCDGKAVVELGGLSGLVGDDNITIVANK